jgi:pimeloyl-ACP methyl ester carboxylesterase
MQLREVAVSRMPQFVLVHGAWHGAWCWSRVLPRLRAAGHDAHAVTLTGVGDRAHLLSRDIRIATHLADVMGLIVCEELDDVVLVGHSYGGMVITGVADRMEAEHPGVLRHVVYVDGSAPHSGESWSTSHKPEVVAARIAAAEATGGVSMPAPDASVFGLEGTDRDWVNRRMTPQPFALYRDPLVFDEARVARLPRTFVDCNHPAHSNIDAMRRRVRSEPGWNVVEIATGHDVMVTEPARLTEVLLACAR